VRNHFASICLTLGLLQGCFLVNGGASSSLEGRYRVEAPAGWVTVNPGGADYSWWNSDSGATIYTDSNCEHHFEDSPLIRLVEAQVVALDEVELLHTESRTIMGRAGLSTLHHGSIDGVRVSVRTTVVKRNGCVYDFVMVGPIGQDTSLSESYDSLVASFEAQD
jgi:hypothetical protein